MAALNEILRRAGEAIQDGDRRTAGILLDQALSVDFTRERTWILLHHLIGKKSGKSIEEFKHFFAQKYYPDKEYLLGLTPTRDLLKSPTRGKTQHTTQPPKSKLWKIVGDINFSINWPLILGFLKRLGFGLLVLVFIVLLSYTGLDMARGVPLKTALSDAIQQTVAYSGKLIRLDLGESAAGSVSLLPVPVIEIVPAVIIRSFGLLGISLLFATILGITLGVWTAGRRSGWSTIVLLVSIIGISVPSFFAALLLQIGVIKLTQATGRTWLPVGGFGWDKHLILPALVLAARPLAQITRVTFVTIEEILSQDFVRTAHGKGLTPRSVTIRHVIKNAAVPVLTTIGLSLRFSLSSLPVVEYFFGWQGIGFTLLKSISRQDDNLTIALALCLGFLFILINLLLELTYPLIDPRLRNLSDGILNKDRRSFSEGIKNFLSKITFWQNSEFHQRWKLKKSPQELSPFQSFINETREGIWQQEKRPERRRTWLKATVGNLPMVLGFILVSIIVVVIAIGPQLAPHSPYTTQGLTIINGEFLIPPFEPDDVYPWGTDVLGRDILSLVLAGTQQTFVLVISIVMTRLVIGFITGALAGWFEGSWFDRFVLAIGEIVSSFPALLLGMILILAIGIRLGIQTFVIALCFIGWMDIMQFVRSQVMITRPKLFIESAVATGAGTLRIVWKHILPNLIPSLVSILALEIGAVLMLLGELGFIGIFIGGGAFADLDAFGPPYHYSDVPEWGALLSGVRTYARSYPWMAIYPVLAFFVAITGFNLLGEGLRRLIDKVGVEVTRLFFNRYAFASVLLVGFGMVWLRGNTGEIAYFERQARTFETQNVMEKINVFTDPVWSGRALGTDGMDYTAKYIAQQFKDLGLQAAGETFTYFQTRPRTFELLEEVPSLRIDDGGPELVYHQDFVEYNGQFFNKGKINGPIRLVQMGNLMVTGGRSRNIPALEDLDYSGEIVMVLTERDAAYIQNVQRGGILLVTEDPTVMARRSTLSSDDRDYSFMGIYGGADEDPGYTPILRITEETAERILGQTGQSITDLRIMADDLVQDEIFELPTNVTAEMEIKGVIPEPFEVQHVVGHLPGVAANINNQLDNQLIVVLAQYDNPPLIPGTKTPLGANDNASGLAVMLEIVRAMQTSGYKPYKTFLFIAYSGEGLEGGERVQPEISKFLQTKYGFSNNFNVEAVVDLRGLGAGDGDSLQISSGGSLRLANLLESAAKRMGVKTRRVGEQIDMSVVFEDGGSFDSGDEAPHVGLRWDGWEATARTSEDTLDDIQREKLEKAGHVLNLFLMILGRETMY